MKIRFTVALPVVLMSACAFSPTPVPVLGDPGAVRSIAGEWAGEYWSLDTGRSGSIFFRLEAGSDSAVGDVLMIPPGQQHDHADGRHPASEYLPITFVRVDHDRVAGILTPYRDPACGCMVETSFEGTHDADTIEGTFTSRHVETRAEQRGRWRVSRSAD
jgi:hypothetical protein